MKKHAFFLLLTISFSTLLSSQTINTVSNKDWGNMRFSGFYESITRESANLPERNSDYFWGINIAHVGNQSVLNKPYHWGAQMVFSINRNNLAPSMYIRNTNELGNGIWAKVIHSKGNHSIDGTLKVKEIEVTINTGADHIFAEDYKLKPLKEVENFIKENKHLPEIPSEKEMQENGLSINEFQIKLLQKIEELTLHVIEQEKKIDEIKTENIILKEENNLIKKHFMKDKN